MQIPFTADEISLIYPFGEQSIAETCASLSAILPQVKGRNAKQKDRARQMMLRRKEKEIKQYLMKLYVRLW